MTETLPPRTKHFGAKFVVTVLLILIAAGAGAAAMYVVQVRKPLAESTQANRDVQLGMPASTEAASKLGDRFTDADGDLLADPPSDPAKFIDPPTLYFSYVAQEDTEKYEKDWKPFCQALSAAVGKPVEYLPVKSTEEQLQALAEGKLHISGLNTGAVPLAVNTAGFVPICRVPTSNEKGTQVEIIVPSGSPITRVSDLKQRTELTLTEPNSNSGYKAPIVLLKSDNSLEPERDYLIRMSGGHEASIEGIAKGEYQSAAVAADMLARREAGGLISKGQYRSIYKSESFPTAAIGYLHNLKPELAAKIKEVLLGYELKGTPLATDFDLSIQTKFVPVTYKNDWALIRRIDSESARLRSGK